MPNQRSKSKAYLGGYIDKRLHDEIKRRAVEAGMANNKFGYVEKMIQQAIARRKRKTSRPSKE
jgi:hypothetical protein